MHRSAARTLLLALPILAAPLAYAGCASDEGVTELPDGGPGVLPPGDGGTIPETGSADGGVEASADAGRDGAPAGDETAPEAIDDLQASDPTHDSVKLTWSAPADDGPTGNASAYEIRYAKTPITNVTEFLAATLAQGATAPKAAGSAETFTVKDLEPDATYHFAIRSRDPAGNASALSNVATTTTKPRAKLLLTEVAPANATGERFIELVTVAAGAAGGITVTDARASGTPVHTFAAIDLAVGDRVVIHVTGLPGPAGFVQEDETKDKAGSTAARASAGAYDVYSAHDAITSTDNVIAVVDGTKTLDAIAFSQRTGAPAAVAMTAYAKARTDLAWSFTDAPVLGTTDCATQLEAVNASGTAVPACPAAGAWPALLTAGYSMQRNGTVDTNTKADWSVGPETPGAENTFCPDAEGATLVINEVNPNIAGSLDLTELYVTKGGWLRGFTLRRDPRDGTPLGQNLATFPDACVATGDVVVVHHAVATNTPSDTTSKDQVPAAANPANYDGAWDFSGLSSQSLPLASSLVLAVRNPAGAYIDAAAFTNGTTSTATYDAALQYVQSLGLWMPADCGGALCSDASTPTSREVGASWTGVGSTAAGSSIRKASPASPATAASWSVGASSFGQGN